MKTRLLATAVTALFLSLNLDAGPLKMFETPRDGSAPLLAAINGAKTSVDVEVYELTDQAILDALVAAANRGVSVRVLLNPQSVHGNPNQAAFEFLNNNACAAKYASTTFKFTHEKGIIVDPGADQQVLLVLTLNLSPGYINGTDADINGSSQNGESLNFGVIDTIPADIANVEAVFNADWNFTQASLDQPGDLIFSPINARSALLQQINGAQKSFHFFAQELNDHEIISALTNAAARGIEVEGVVSDNLVKPAVINNLNGNGVGIKVLNTHQGALYEHAKAAVADGTTAYIGSINYTKGSMDDNRELGIMISDTSDGNTVAADLETEFQKYWAQAQ